VANRAGLWMRVTEGGQTPTAAFDDMADRPIKGTTDWKQVQVVLDVSPRAEGITIGALLTETGTVWVSGLRLEVVDRTVAITGRHERQNEQPMNLDFTASGEIEGGFPAGWSRAGSHPYDYEISVDRRSLHHGRPIAVISSIAGKIDGFGTLLQGMAATRYRGKRLRLAAEVKAERVVDWAGLWLRIDGPSGALAFDNMHGRPITGTSDWRRYEVILDVAAAAQEIVFGVLLQGTGKLSIGDLTVEELPRDSLRSAWGDPLQPENLDFSR
jgi:hypothetical protein